MCEQLARQLARARSRCGRCSPSCAPRVAPIPSAAQVMGVTTLDVVRANTFVAEAKGLDTKVGCPRL